MISAPINFELNIQLHNILQIVIGEQDQISIPDGEWSFTLSFHGEDPLFLRIVSWKFLVLQQACITSLFTLFIFTSVEGTYAVISSSKVNKNESKSDITDITHLKSNQNHILFDVKVPLCFVTTFLFIYFSNLKLCMKKWYSSHWFHVYITKWPWYKNSFCSNRCYCAFIFIVAKSTTSGKTLSWEMYNMC